MWYVLILLGVIIVFVIRDLLEMVIFVKVWENLGLICYVFLKKKIFVINVNGWY